MAITFPASPSNGDVFTNSTTGVKYIYNATDGVWKTHVWPTNTNYLQLSGGTLTGNLALGTNDLTAQDINSTTLTTTGGVTAGNGLTVSDGNIVMAAGHGIDFSANSNASGMTSELLDDYEEGTWTPTLVNGTGTFDSATWGQYTKIGRRVYLNCFVKIDTMDDTNNGFIIGGVPFTPVDPGTGGFVGSIMCNEFRWRRAGGNFDATMVSPYITDTTNGIRIYGQKNDNGWDSLKNVDINVDDQMYIQISFNV